MYALIPCPEGLLPDVKRYLKYPRPDTIEKSYEGFWLVSQDPSLIAQVGAAAVCADSVNGLRDAVDRKFGLPYGFSRLALHHVRCYSWDKGNSYYGGEDKTILTAKREFAQKCVHDEDKAWTVAALLPAPRVIDDKLDDLAVLVEAKRHPQGVYCNKFKLPDTRKVAVYKDEFVLEQTALGTKVVYSPKRAKRLFTLRRKHATVGVRQSKRTCFRLMQLLVSALRDTYKCDAIHHLYYERWSSYGMQTYGDAILAFFDMARRMGKLHTARKKIRPLLREMAMHQKRINRSCKFDFCAWYIKELKRAGGPPRNTSRYMEVVKKHEEVQKGTREI